MILCDRAGAIYDGRPEHMNPAKEDIARNTNPEKESGSLEDVIRGQMFLWGYLGLVW